MTQVKIKVGPRSYPIACGPGDEEKVTKFGALIDRNYAKLGTARAAQEADNVVYAALFLADELDEAQEFMRDAKVEITELKQELQRAQDDAANAIQKANSENATTKERSGSKKAELQAEIATLRKAEERARKENAALKAQIADMEERARHQHDLFGGPAEDAALSDALAQQLEALALRAESTASELEAKADAH
ncbi:MAG: cell division protein ZapA [Pseudomonadota bacterium]